MVRTRRPTILRLTPVEAALLLAWPSDAGPRAFAGTLPDASSIALSDAELGRLIRNMATEPSLGRRQHLRRVFQRSIGQLLGVETAEVGGAPREGGSPETPSRQASAVGGT